jgi:endonuclease/exonuclease/phosphatase family metal-dependent hydrolase
MVLRTSRIDDRVRNPANEPDTSVVVASYNIQKAVGADLRRNPARTLAVMKEINADIYVLQEADRRFGARHSALSLPLVAAHGWRPVPFETRPDSIGWHGNAILVSERVEILRHSILPIPSLEPRGAVLADLAIGGRRLRVIGMHLDLSGLWRRRQAEAILAHLVDQQESVPTLLMGDLNEWRATAGAVADFARGHRHVRTGPTFHAKLPVATLDRIFASHDLSVEAAGVHHTALAAVASDHLPVWVRLGLGAG